MSNQIVNQTLICLPRSPSNGDFNYTVLILLNRPLSVSVSPYALSKISLQLQENYCTKKWDWHFFSISYCVSFQIIAITKLCNSRVNYGIMQVSKLITYAEIYTPVYVPHSQILVLAHIIVSGFTYLVHIHLSHNDMKEFFAEKKTGCVENTE